MKIEDIPPHLRDVFIEHFDTYHHGEEFLADPETFNQCANMDDCFGKLGPSRMQAIFNEFCEQSPEFWLYANSDTRYDD